MRDVEKMKEMKDRRRVSRIKKITFTNYRVYQTISLVGNHSATQQDMTGSSLRKPQKAVVIIE